MVYLDLCWPAKKRNPLQKISFTFLKKIQYCSTVNLPLKKFSVSLLDRDTFWFFGGVVVYTAACTVDIFKFSYYFHPIYCRFLIAFKRIQAKILKKELQKNCKRIAKPSGFLHSEFFKNSIGVFD